MKNIKKIWESMDENQRKLIKPMALMVCICAPLVYFTTKKKVPATVTSEFLKTARSVMNNPVITHF